MIYAFNCNDYKTVDCNLLTFGACDREVLQNYSEGLYIPLNRHLRGIEIDQSCEKIRDQIYGSLMKMPELREETTVFRGLNTLPVFKDLNVGECFIDLGFVSTSLHKDVARGFAYGNSEPAMMEIRTIHGRNISNISYASGETEILLLPGTALLLEKVESDGVLNIYRFRETASVDCKILKN